MDERIASFLNLTRILEKSMQFSDIAVQMPIRVCVQW
jgi:hypothetical protein